MTQTAINALCEMLSQDDDNVGQWERKAEIICQFAFKVSEQVLLRAGFVKPSTEGAGDDAEELWLGNSLVSLTDNEVRIPDHVTELCLNKVDSALSRSETYRAEDTEVLLVFARGRVLDWNEKTKRPRRVMTYEEAARFIVFWLAEKILQICRKNEWDRIKQLPDLFDRLTTFAFAPKPVSYGAELQKRLKLEYNPELLLRPVEELNLSIRAYNLLKNHNCSCIGDVICLNEQDVLRFRQSSIKVVNELKEELRMWNFHLGMELPPEVKEWCNSQK